jgi:glycosyltransferase involved in cell wall biosynthesis
MHNPDVASAGADAYDHWIGFGIQEGRYFSAAAFAKQVPRTALRKPHATYFKWGNDLVETSLAAGMANAIVDQILVQGEHDPLVLGAGALALPHLPVHTLGHVDIDLERLFERITIKPRIIFAIPLLTIGGGEKFAADLCGVFLSNDAGPVLVIVTDQTEADAGAWRDIAILAPFRETALIFWPDLSPNVWDVQLLASLLTYLAPKILIVTYSGVCLQAIADYGKRLSQKSKLFCSYFNLGDRGLGAPYGVTFARQTSAVATSLTDNEPAALALDRRYRLIGKPAVVIPPRVEIAPDQVFAERLAMRASKISASSVRKWVWVSRLEPAKGLSVLRELAISRPGDIFDLYGPLAAPLHQLGLDVGGIRHQGVLANVLSADFSGYQGFIFTSPLEGMPNIVLEMGQHAIPMILSDAGGIRQTFDEGSAMLVANGPNPCQTARAFSDACERLMAMSGEEQAQMVTRARRAIADRHAPARFSARVARVFGL